MKPLNIKLPHDKIVLLPLCCVHYPIGEKHLLEDWVKQMKSTKNAYAFLLGDSFDAARSHFRNHVKSYTDDSNSQEALDRWMEKDVDGLAKILAPVKNKILAVVRGNHYWQFLDGTNSEQKLCKKLGVPYLGAMSLVRLSTKRGSIIVYIHHSGGGGGARTGSGDMASLSKQELGWKADVFLAGHTHRRQAWKEVKLGLTDGDNPEPVQHMKVFARCGTLLQGYKLDHPNSDQPHEPAYAELRSYRPTDLGWVEIRVSWKDDGRPDFEVVS